MSQGSTIAAVMQDERGSVLGALRRMGGRATIGDAVAATGLARDRVELTLKDLLSEFRGHIAVGDSGDLLFEFDRKLIRRDHESWWGRFKRGAKRVLSAAFKAWIVVMLVVYFVLFVALVIAALVAMMSGDRRGNDSRRGPRMRIPTFWIWYMFWTRDWRYGRPYYGHRWESRRGQKVPFYKKVFAFVFGPDSPPVTREAVDREKISLIRARRGVLGVAELVEFTGLPSIEATEEMGRLMGAYDGDVRVTPGGELVYVFPELMLSAHGRVKAREPEPAWRRLQNPLAVTGNKTTDDVLIGAMNGFNLVASLSAPWFIFPRLGVGGPLAWIGLVAVPLTFSAIFFAIPFVRRMLIRRENRARIRNNVRKVLLGTVYEAGIEGRSVTTEGATRWVRTALKDETLDADLVIDELRRLAAEYDAPVEMDDGGNLSVRFPTLRGQLAAAERIRSTLRLDQKEIGDIVYSTGDSQSEESERDLEQFDSALRRRLPAPQRTAYADDLELALFDEKLASR